MYTANFESVKYDDCHNKSPYYIYLDEQFFGGLTKKECTQQVLDMLQKAFDQGKEAGKKQRSKEFRALLEVDDARNDQQD